jgi:hypothetical protein
MFLLDDLLFMPVAGVFAIFREIRKAAQQEIMNEADTIRARLAELYMQLETGRITEVEFDSQERKLLDRLDEIESSGTEQRDDGEAQESSEVATLTEEQLSCSRAGHHS